MSSTNPPTSRSGPQITLRIPTSPFTTTTTTTTTAFTPPPLPWFLGTWHVTHSTLPIWSKARNVSITYTTLPSSPDKLDDKVTYQSLPSSGSSGGSAKVNTISGIDTPAEGVQGVWNWRGNGWLMMVSSRWEVLGWGDEEDGAEGEGEKGQWVVTYFASTMFTPAGIDIYSRRKEGLGEKTLEAVREALRRVDADIVKGLVGKMFEVKRD